MKIVRLVRHGESAAIAGAATLDHATIPLTDKGIEQATQVAKSITRDLGLVAVSPYTRAQATAEATISVFPGIPCETWPIEEFTYLAPKKCVNTTVSQRRGWVERYWAQADPSYVDGEGAESFQDLVGRVRSFLGQLAAHPAQAILVFSHGQFLNTVVWLIEHNPAQIDGQAMIDWREFEIANHIPNGWGFQLVLSEELPFWTVTRSIDPDGAHVVAPPRSEPATSKEST